MVFKKKWTDEQDKRILELHKRISNEEIAKEFKITSKAVSKRVSYLKKLNPKQKKKIKKPGKKDIKKGSKSDIKKSKEKRIEVIEAPTHENADELRKEYETKPINSEEPQETPMEETQEEILESETPTPEVPQVNWTGVSNTITAILDKRFVVNGLAPLTDEEKALFSDATNQVLELRAKFYFQYADIFNLGLAGFSILTPRILEFLDREKQKKITKEASTNLDLTEKTPEIPKIVDEKAEAQRRYDKMVQSHE